LKERFVEVRGTGLVSFKPDEATLVFSVEDSSTSASDSLRVCSDRVKRLLGDFESLKMPGLTLGQGPSLFFPDGRSDSEASGQFGVSCWIPVTATLDVAKGDLAGRSAALMDAARRTGAAPVFNSGGHLFFRVRAFGEVSKKAMSGALASARARGASLATAAGLGLGKIISVKEEVGPGPVESAAGYASLFSSRPTGEVWIFDGKSIQWRKTVTVRFALVG